MVAGRFPDLTPEEDLPCSCASTSCRPSCLRPKRQDPNAAAALQELLGGKYGEMSTLGNYMFQSFNFRSKSKLRPFYSLVASITAEELGHVELVSNGVAMLNNGPDNDGDEEDGGDISRRAVRGHEGHPVWRRPSSRAAAAPCR